MHLHSGALAADEQGLSSSAGHEGSVHETPWSNTGGPKSTY